MHDLTIDEMFDKKQDGDEFFMTAVRDVTSQCSTCNETLSNVMPDVFVAARGSGAELPAHVIEQASTGAEEAQGATGHVWRQMEIQRLRRVA